MITDGRVTFLTAFTADDGRLLNRIKSVREVKQVVLKLGLGRKPGWATISSLLLPLRPLYWRKITVL